MLVQGEDVAQAGLANVKTHEDGFLLHKGEAGGKVGGNEGFAFAGTGGGAENDVLPFLQQILEVGAQAAEDFFHDFVAVLADSDAAVFREAGLRDVAHDNHVGDALDIGTAFDAELQSTRKPDAANGETQTEHKGNHIEVTTVGSYLTRYTGRLDHAAVVGLGSQGDGIFLALLQEHEVKFGLDFLLAGDVAQLLLLAGGRY